MLNDPHMLSERQDLTTAKEPELLAIITVCLEAIDLLSLVDASMSTHSEAEERDAMLKDVSDFLLEAQSELLRRSWSEEQVCIEIDGGVQR